MGWVREEKKEGNYLKTENKCGEPFQVWEMWLSPHSEKPLGSEVGGQDTCPWTGSPWEIRPALYLDCYETCSG